MINIYKTNIPWHANLSHQHSPHPPYFSSESPLQWTEQSHWAASAHTPAPLKYFSEVHLLPFESGAFMSPPVADTLRWWVKSVFVFFFTSCFKFGPLFVYFWNDSLRRSDWINCCHSLFFLFNVHFSPWSTSFILLLWHDSPQCTTGPEHSWGSRHWLFKAEFGRATGGIRG